MSDINDDKGLESSPPHLSGDEAGNDEPLSIDDVREGTFIQGNESVTIGRDMVSIDHVSGDKVYLDRNIHFDGNIHLDKIDRSATPSIFLASVAAVISLLTLITGVIVSDRLTLFIALPVAVLVVVGIALYWMAFAREYKPHLSYTYFASASDTDVRTAKAPYKYRPLHRYIMLAGGVLLHLAALYMIMNLVAPNLGSAPTPVATPTVSITPTP